SAAWDQAAASKAAAATMPADAITLFINPSLGTRDTNDRGYRGHSTPGFGKVALREILDRNRGGIVGVKPVETLFEPFLQPVAHDRVGYGPFLRQLGRERLCLVFRGLAYHHGVSLLANRFVARQGGVGVVSIFRDTSRKNIAVLHCHHRTLS